MVTKVPIIIQLRRGTSTQVAGFTPAQGEVVADMTYLRESVGSGSQAGGYPLGRANLKTLTDASTYSVLNTDVIIAMSSLTTTSTNNLNLPAANAFPVGQELRIQNGTTIAGTITVKANGTDSINSTTQISISGSAAGRTMVTNGSTGWFAWST